MEVRVYERWVSDLEGSGRFLSKPAKRVYSVCSVLFLANNKACDKAHNDSTLSLLKVIRTVLFLSSFFHEYRVVLELNCLGSLRSAKPHRLHLTVYTAFYLALIL